MQQIRRLTIALGSLIVLALAQTPAPATAQIVVRLGTIAPEQSVWHDALLRIRQAWRDLSNGEVELRIYAGGVLGGEDEMIRKMQRRGLDAIAISGSALPQVHDIVSCVEMPLLFDSYEQLARVREAVAPALQARIEERGYKVLGWLEAGWVHFFSQDPVRVPEDLRRQRLWISTGAREAEQLFTELGFRVVALPATDMMTGLQTGLIDAIDVPPLFALVDRSYREARHMTDLGFSPLNSAVLMNLSIWERIPETYHAGLVTAVQDAIERLRVEIQTAEREAIAEMAARGLTVVELTDAEVAEWEALAESVYPELTCAQKYPELYERVLRLQREDSAAHAG